MAKKKKVAKKTEGNKSKQIRELLKQQPNLKPTEVAEKLKCNISLVYAVKRGGTTKSTKSKQTTKTSKEKGDFSVVKTAMEFVDASGSLNRAQTILNQLKKMG